MDLESVTAHLASLGEPEYRSRQVREAVSRGLTLEYQQMTNLPAALRRRLADEAPLRELEERERQESADGTIKLRLATRDGYPVEAVAMRHRNRHTVCLSSQSGCPLACTFCATGSMGLGRNLGWGEIAEQAVLLAGLLRQDGRRVSNIVMMGMGEPFLNYDAVLDACRFLNDRDGFALGARQIAISTAGWVPGIERLAGEPLQLRLALSLHAPTDQLREQLMPVNRRFPLSRVMQACRDYRRATGRRVFVEYLLLDGVNDRDGDAHRLASLLDRDRAGFHVNLIAYNPTGHGYRASPPERVRAFAGILEAAGLHASYRRSHGRDIDAACGQLAVSGVRELRRARPVTHP
ncbi:MAG TPA: 23S rRNA (adenine(2503)-C(2))-methyltransferase RlmN [Gaiellales bacterium]|nr:23S rRNA (adenine(2503)-C(2))-methyltransferase RlmN [Gaiellales bacterium]